MAYSFTYKGIEYKSLSNFYLLHKDRATIPADTFLRRVKNGMGLEEALTTPRGDLKNHMAISFSHKGKEYKSLGDFYRLHKTKTTVSRAGFLKRVRNGMDLEEALTRRNIITGSHVVEGVTYPNVSAIGKAYGIHLHTIFRNYRRGKRGDELVPEKKRKNYVEPIKEVNYKFFFDGVGYKSKADACRKNGVIYETFKDRLSNGWTMRQALGIEKVERKQWKKITVEGKEFASIEEAARTYGLNSTTVRNRIKRGLSIDEAFKRTLQKVVVEGKEFASLEEAVRTYGLNNTTVRNRIKRGLSIDEAFKKPIRSNSNSLGKKIMLEGKEYPSLRAAARAYGLNINTIFSRINISGYSIEEAFELVETELSKKTKVIVEGKEYPSLRAAARAYNLPYDFIRGRIKKSGYSIDDAFTLPKDHSRKREIVVEGKEYSSITEIAHTYNQNPYTVGNRLRRGLTPEQAIGLDFTHLQDAVTYNGKTYPHLPALAKELGIRYGLLSGRIAAGLTIEEAIGLGNETVKGFGSYSEKKLARDPELASKDATLYFVSLIFEGKLFYKVGITTRFVEERFSGLDFVVEETYQSTLYNCYKMEQELLNLFSEYITTDSSVANFGGHTEIFELTPDLVQDFRDFMHLTVQENSDN